jgi:hypothetical protein
VGRDGSVGIAIRNYLNGPGIEYRWGEEFHTRPYRIWGPPTHLYNGYRVIPGSKTVWVGVDHPQHLAPRLKEE